MTPDDFATFRAAHPALPDAMARCERPDWLLRLAWEAGFDKRALIREGADAANLLLASELQHNLELFWPVPRPLEAVDRWSENSTPSNDITTGLRHQASAVVPGALIGGLLSHFVVAPRMSGYSAELLMVLSVVAAFAVVAVLFKILIAAALRRQIARLDEESAFAIVLDQLRVGMARKPTLIPRATLRITRGLKLLAPANG